MSLSFLAAFVLLLCSQSFAWAQAYYASDPIGLELGKLSPQEAAKTEWVLAVRFQGTTKIRTLSHSGNEVQRWEDEYDRGQLVAQKVYENGELASNSRYEEGRVAEETDYEAAKVKERRVYHYAGQELTGVDLYSGEGKLLYQDRYERATDGRLRRAVRTYPDGTYFESLYSYAGGRLESEWQGTESIGDRYLYDDGTLVATESWKGDQILRQADFAQSGAERIAKETDFATGRVVTKTYAADGRQLREEVSVNGKAVEVVDFAYEDGRLATRIDRTPGVREESRYFYDAKGDRTKVEVTRNRVLVKVTHYTTDNEYYDELYSNGSAFLRVYYKDGSKIKEEVVGG